MRIGSESLTRVFPQSRCGVWRPRSLSYSTMQREPRTGVGRLPSKVGSRVLDRCGLLHRGRWSLLKCKVHPHSTSYMVSLENLSNVLRHFWYSQSTYRVSTNSLKRSIILPFWQSTEGVWMLRHCNLTRWIWQNPTFLSCHDRTSRGPMKTMMWKGGWNFPCHQLDTNLAIWVLKLFTPCYWFSSVREGELWIARISP